MGLAIKIEDMALEAERLRSLLLATYDAIYNGCNGYEEFDGALNAVFWAAHDHMEHMKELMDEAYVLQKMENEKGCEEKSRKQQIW